MKKLLFAMFATTAVTCPAVYADSIIGGPGTPCEPSEFVDESFSCQLKNGGNLEVQYSGNNCDNFVRDVHTVILNGKELKFREGRETAQGIVISRAEKREVNLKVWQDRDILTRIEFDYYRDNGTDCRRDRSCGDNELLYFTDLSYKQERFNERTWSTDTIKKRKFEIVSCSDGLFNRL